MTKVAVTGQVLLWAIERSGLNIRDLRGKFPKIVEWTDGADSPTLRQLESLAKVTRTPLGFFFLEKPPVDRLPIPHFRTTEDQGQGGPSPDLLESVQVMQQRQAWLREYLINLGQDKLEFVRSEEVGSNPSSVAQQLRKILGFDEHWAAVQATWSDALRSLREAMERSGIVVVVNGVVGNNTHRKLSVSEFRGFVLVDDYAPLVFVNGSDGKAAQMFTLAHELAHVVFGSSAAFDLRQMQPSSNRTEKACNAVAAEFLVPESLLRSIWPSVRDSSAPFQELAREFKVSAIVAARRALDLRLVDRARFLDFYQDYLNQEFRATSRRGEGGDFYLSQNLKIGRRFALAVVQATKEGKLLYHDAYHLTGLFGNTFERFSDALIRERTNG